MSLERLQKILARSGYGARRRCEELIAAGRVSVNGLVVGLGTKIDVNTDTVALDGQLLDLAKSEHIYLMLNKPSGCLSTVKDERGRPTVMDYLPDLPTRVYPVGRLDKDTEGLLLFTNDGEVTFSVAHPRHFVEKEYLAVVRVAPSPLALTALASGIVLDDGPTSPAKAALLPDGRVQLIIREGRKRQVRRMLAEVGCPVVELQRVRVGDLHLGELKLGEWRHLTSGEVAYLKSISAQSQMAGGSCANT